MQIVLIYLFIGLIGQQILIGKALNRELQVYEDNSLIIRSWSIQIRQNNYYRLKWRFILIVVSPILAVSAIIKSVSKKINRE